MANRALIQEIRSVPTFNSSGVATLLCWVVFLPDDGRAPVEREVLVSVNLLADNVATLQSKIGAAIRALGNNTSDPNVPNIAANDIVGCGLVKY